MEFFKFTHRETGAITYEPVAGRKPGEVARAMPEYMVGMTATPPVEIREAHGVEVKVGCAVHIRAYGKVYRGEVVKVGTKIAHVKIRLVGGAEKVLRRPIAEVTVVI